MALCYVLQHFHYFISTEKFSPMNSHWVYYNLIFDEGHWRWCQATKRPSRWRFCSFLYPHKYSHISLMAYLFKNVISLRFISAATTLWYEVIMNVWIAINYLLKNATRLNFLIVLLNAKKFQFYEVFRRNFKQIIEFIKEFKKL